MLPAGVVLAKQAAHGLIGMFLAPKVSCTVNAVFTDLPFALTLPRFFSPRSIIDKPYLETLPPSTSTDQAIKFEDVPIYHQR